MHLTQASITDIRSVWGPSVRLPIGRHVTVLVGLNRSGTSNLAFAVAAALDPHRHFLVDRDLPRGRDSRPSVELEANDGGRATVLWDARDGARQVAGSIRHGPSVFCGVADTPQGVLGQVELDLDSEQVRAELADTITTTMRTVIPEVASTTVTASGEVVIIDDRGTPIAEPVIRAIVALAFVRYLAQVGRAPAVVVVEAPEAFLHPAGQGVVASLLVEIAAQIDAPVLATTTSPFVIPRVATSVVVGVARDVRGRTAVIGSARGDQTQAQLIGWLLDDPGLASVLDRVGQISPHTRAILIVEGGTDEAYLRVAARVLERDEVLEDVEIRPGGGAMSAAMSAIVLRAELDIPVVVLLDHDEQGRRARDTLTSRFAFDRSREVVTYADVYDGHPRDIVAETLFDLELVRRFVAEHVREDGYGVSHGEKTVDGIVQVELTAAGKSTFVGWLDHHLRSAHLARWDALLDLLAERFNEPSV